MTGELDRLATDARAQVAEVLRAAAVGAGGLVLSADLTFDEAADWAEALAAEYGVADTADVLDAIGRGMAGETETSVTAVSQSPPTPRAAPTASETAGTGFRDADGCAVAVMAWAGVRLMADPAGRVTSADLAASWAADDGRALVGYGSLTEAVMEWARVDGLDVGRHRTSRGRGLTGIRWVDVTPSAANVTVEVADDVTPPVETAPPPVEAGDTPADPSINESVVADRSAYAMQARPPAHGWQVPAALADAASVDMSDWVAS